MGSSIVTSIVFTIADGFLMNECILIIGESDYFGEFNEPVLIELFKGVGLRRPVGRYRNVERDPCYEFRDFSCYSSVLIVGVKSFCYS